MYSLSHHLGTTIEILDNPQICIYIYIDINTYSFIHVHYYIYTQNPTDLLSGCSHSMSWVMPAIGIVNG